MQQYPYSGSDDEHQEAEVAGEPSSIIQAPGENTLRKNFQVVKSLEFFQNRWYSDFFSELGILSKILLYIIFPIISIFQSYCIHIVYFSKYYMQQNLSFIEEKILDKSIH